MPFLRISSGRVVYADFRKHNYDHVGTELFFSKLISALIGAIDRWNEEHVGTDRMVTTFTEENIEVNWVVVEASLHAADIALDVEYSTGGEGQLPDDPEFHTHIQREMLAYLMHTTHLWRGLRCSLWVKPQHGARFGIELRTKL